MTRESQVERAHRDLVEAEGGRLLKFVSPGLNGAPDRILLRPVLPGHQAIVAQYLRFVEFKAPGKKPRPSQVREHERLRAMGFVVDVIDRKEEK